MDTLLHFSGRRGSPREQITLGTEMHPILPEMGCLGSTASTFSIEN
jgi:hypothetical protein